MREGNLKNVYNFIMIFRLVLKNLPGIVDKNQKGKIVSPKTYTENDNPSDSQAAADLLLQIRNLLAFHQDIGIDAYPLTAPLKAFITGKPKSTARKPPEKGKERLATQAPAQQKQAPAKRIPLNAVEKDLGDCVRCGLHTQRHQIIFGQGNSHAELMIISDWPTGTDDREGLPFTGEAGALLDKMLAAINTDRQKIYISTIIKCYPGEREPTPDEIKTCLPFLLKQIDSIAPAVICAMGPHAAQMLLRANEPLFRLRGRFHDFRGIALMPTFHPDFLIKNPEMKKAAWHDLQMIRKRCGA